MSNAQVARAPGEAAVWNSQLVIHVTSLSVSQCRCISAENAQTASAAAVEALQPDASPKVTRAALGTLAALKRQGLSGPSASLSSQQLSQVSSASVWVTHIPALPPNVARNVVMVVDDLIEAGA